MPNVFVETPKRVPRKGGIKAITGEFLSVPRLGLGGELEWIADGCTFPKVAPGLCYATTPVTGDKTFDGIGIGAGPVFGLYSGVECYLGPNSDYLERAASALEQGEARGVEEVLWEWAVASAGTPVTEPDGLNAIAEAEEAADTRYLGTPVIIMSRESAVRARAASALDGDKDGNLWTANGTPVIATAAASDDTLVIIGWPTVYASEIVSTIVVDHIVNRELAIAERIYGIAVDCEFAVAFKLPSLGAPAITLSLVTVPADQVEVGTPLVANVTVTGEATEPIILYTQRNDDPAYEVGPMTEVTPTTFTLEADTTGLTVGDIYALYASHGGFSGAPRTPLTQVEVIGVQPPTLTSVTPSEAAIGVSTQYTVVGTNLPDTIAKVDVLPGQAAYFFIDAGSLTPTGFTFTANLRYPASFPDETHFDINALNSGNAVIVGLEDALTIPTLVLTQTVTPTEIYKGETFTVDITASADPANAVMVQLSSDDGAIWQNNGNATEVTPTTFTREITTNSWTPRDGILVRSISGPAISDVDPIDVKADPTFTLSAPTTTVPYPDDDQDIPLTVTASAAAAIPPHMFGKVSSNAVKDLGLMTEVTPTEFTFLYTSNEGVNGTTLEFHAEADTVVGPAITLTIGANPPAALTSINPDEADSADDTTFTIVGTDLAAMTKARFTDAASVNTDVALATTGATSVTVVATLPVGVYDVALINDDATVTAAPLTDALTVVTVPAPPPAPVFTPPSPAPEGTPTLTITVTLAEPAPVGWDIVSAHQHNGAGPWEVRLHTPDANRTVWTHVITITDHNGRDDSWEVMAGWSNGDVQAPISGDELPAQDIVDNYGPSAFWELDPVAPVLTVLPSPAVGNQDLTATVTFPLPSVNAITLHQSINGGAATTSTGFVKTDTDGKVWALTVPALGLRTGDSAEFWTTEAYFGESNHVTVTFTSPPPTITSVAPTEFTAAGGEDVTLTGTGFTGTTDFWMDGRAVTDMVIVNDTTITGKTPNFSTTGVKDLFIINPAGNVELQDGYTVVQPEDQVTGINPTSGPASGGTNLFISGFGLGSVTQVTFGSFFSTTLSNITDTGFTVRTPAVPGAQTTSVVVKRPEGDLTSPQQFTFTALDDPVPLAITAPEDGAEVDPLVNIIGTAPRGSTVDLYMASSPGAPVASVETNEDGLFEFVGSTPMEVSPETITVGVGDERSESITVTIAGVPDEGWTIAELKEFAADHEPPIHIPSTANKAEILALIEAAINEEN